MEQLRKERRIHDEIIAIILIAIGIFLVISLMTKTTGALGVVVQGVLFGCFGKICSFILSGFLILYGILIFAEKASLITARSVICMVAMFLLISCLATPLETIPESFSGKMIPQFYANGAEGGGVVGTLLAMLLVKVTGKTGYYLISIAGIIITLLFIVNTPLSTFFDQLRIKRIAAKELREEEKDLAQSEAAERQEAERKAIAAEKQSMRERRKAEEQLSIADIKPEPKKPEAKDQKDDSMPKLDTSSMKEFTVASISRKTETNLPSNIIDYDSPRMAEIHEPKKSEEQPAAPEAVPEEKKPEEVPGPTPEEILEAQKTERFNDMTKGLPDNQKKILGYVYDDVLVNGAKKIEGYGLDADPAPTHSDAEAPKAETKPAEKAAPAPKKKLSAAETAEKTAEVAAEISAANAEPAPKGYQFPSIELLNKPSASKSSSMDGIEEKARKLNETLQSFKVNASVVDVVKGPAVTRFEVQPAPGVKVASIKNLQDDIALSLKAKSIRIEAPIPGKAAVGIEVSNDSISMVTLREILESKEFKKAESKISVCLGRGITGESIVADLKKMPHLLIAGATGSGKSVCINSIIMSLLYKAKPDEVKLILIDPKVVELSNYNGIPHLLIPVVTEPAKASAALGWAVAEMNDRYNRFAEEGVRDLKSYNEAMKSNGEEEKIMPQVVIIIDELADLIMAAQNAVEDSICRLAQKARAAGMHLIVATQRPSVDVITGVIKANIPSRIAFAVSSAVDSRTILDMSGAEKLLGKGDMLYAPQDISTPLRVQGCFVSDNEVNKVIDFVKSNVETASYSDEIASVLDRVVSESSKGGGSADPDDDDLLPDAIECVVRAEQASVSMLQRRFRIGYNRAARLIDIMEERGIVSAADGSRPRKVNMTVEELEGLQAQLKEIEEEI